MGPFLAGSDNKDASCMGDPLRMRLGFLWTLRHAARPQQTPHRVPSTFDLPHPRLPALLKEAERDGRTEGFLGS